MSPMQGRMWRVVGSVNQMNSPKNNQDSTSNAANRKKLSLN